jgi:hypothetical protein
MTPIIAGTEQSDGPRVLNDDSSAAQVINRIVVEHARTLRHGRPRPTAALRPQDQPLSSPGFSNRFRRHATPAEGGGLGTVTKA